MDGVPLAGRDAGGARIGAVLVRAVDELDAAGDQLVADALVVHAAARIEDHAGDERVHVDLELVAAVVADGDDALAGAVALLAVDRERDDVGALGLVAIVARVVEVGEEVVVAKADRLVHRRDDLRDAEQIGEAERDVRGLHAQPAAIAVLDLGLEREQVLRVLDATEVRVAHVRRRPRRVLGEVRDVVPVAGVRVDRDHRVVRRAAAERARARVEHALGGLLRVERGLGLIGVVIDEVVPAHRGVLGRLRVQRRHLVGDVERLRLVLRVLAALIVAGLEEEDRVAADREVRRERSAAGAGADDDVLVGARLAVGLALGVAVAGPDQPVLLGRAAEISGAAQGEERQRDREANGDAHGARSSQPPRQEPRERFCPVRGGRAATHPSGTLPRGSTDPTPPRPRRCNRRRHAHVPAWYTEAPAGVAKLANAGDLKSLAAQAACGFDSRPRHRNDSSVPSRFRARGGLRFLRSRRRRCRRTLRGP